MSTVNPFDALLDRFERLIADAFNRSIQELRDRADVSRLIAALLNRDIEEAVSAVHIQPEAFDPLANSIREGFTDAGTTAVDVMPHMMEPDGQAAVLRFSVRNPRAEQWLAEESGTLITNITADQRVGIRNALVAGLSRGENPEDTALDIVGRMSGGRRVGGVIGLTAAQEAYVRNARDELASGDPGMMKSYLDRQLRDRRFDGIVERAIAAEKPVDPEDIARLEQRYRDRLLMMRGEMIGRTESLTAIRAGKNEAYEQAIDSGVLKDVAVVKIWRSAGDDRVRDTHAELDGTTVPMDEPFVSPSGAHMMFPGDTSLGAPADEIINCRCDVEYLGDFLSGLGEEEPPPGELTAESEIPVETPEPLVEVPIDPEEFDAVDYTEVYTDPSVTPEAVEADVEERRGITGLVETVSDYRARVKAGTQTKDLNLKPDGTYTDERDQLHMDILYLGQWETTVDTVTGETTRTYIPPIFSAEEIEKAQPPEGEAPTFTMLGGRGGSGKSKLKGIAYDPSTAIVLDNDTIKARLPGYEAWNAALFHEEASDIFDEATNIARRYGLNVVQDATMKTTAKAVAMVQSFIDAGYETEAAYMYLPAQEAAARSVERFLTDKNDYSGRFVPPEVVLSNTTNEASFNAVKDIVDRWAFFDNQFGGPDDKAVLVSSYNWTSLETRGAGPELPIAALRYEPMEPGLDMPEQRNYNPNSAEQQKVRADLEKAHAAFAKVGIPEPRIEDIEYAGEAYAKQYGLELNNDPRRVPPNLVKGVVAGKEAINELVGDVPGFDRLSKYLNHIPVALQEFTGADGYTFYNDDRTSVIVLDTKQASLSRLGGNSSGWHDVTARMYGGTPKDAYTMLYLHEMGHAIDNMSGGRLSQAFAASVLSEMDKESAPTSPYGELLISGWMRNNISEYASSNVAEGWAEAFSLWMGNRMGLKFSMNGPMGRLDELMPIDIRKLLSAKS